MKLSKCIQEHYYILQQYFSTTVVNTIVLSQVFPCTCFVLPSNSHFPKHIGNPSFLPPCWSHKLILKALPLCLQGVPI